MEVLHAVAIRYGDARHLGLGLLCAAVFCRQLSLPACAVVAAGGEYQLESSVRDSGGGGVLNGAGYSARGSAGQYSIPDGQETSVSDGYVNRVGFYNPPHFTFQKGLPAVIAPGPGTPALSLPAGAVGKEVFDITLNNDPAAMPLSVKQVIIDEANRKMERNEGAWSRLMTRQMAELAVFDEEGAWTKPFLKSGTLALNCQDADNDGIVDGSNPPVRVDTVRTWMLDEKAAMWAKLPSAPKPAGSGTLSVQLMAPGVYSLLGMIDDSVADTYAFPVPFRPNGPAAGAGAGQTGTEAEGITFINVPQAGDISVYTLDGRLVRRLTIPDGLVVSKLKWDVRTSGGQRVASGVYIWRAVSGANSKTGKLMVIW